MDGKVIVGLLVGVVAVGGGMARGAVVTATIVPGSFSQGAIAGGLGTGTSYANVNNSIGDWWTSTSNLNVAAGTKSAISFTNGNFNNANNGNATIIAFGNGGGMTLHLSQTIHPVAGQKEFGLFTAQFYNASTGGLFSGNMESAILVSADGVNWVTLDGTPVASPTTYNATSYKLNAPCVGYNFGTLATAWSYGSPGTTLANLNGLPAADYTLPMPNDDLFNGSGTNAQRLAMKTDATPADYAAIFGNSGGGNWFDLSSSGLDDVNYVRLNGVNNSGGVRLDAVFANPAAVPEPGSLSMVAIGLLTLARRGRRRG